ncbi:hypothetical protein [Nitrosospira multiformis]|jgi:protease secretion system outer membrane protein|uniref:hypothetical protein n=1 Tax=Nitrosospira multiformis TaxID=1231 RepID=UPI000D3152E3|nr:hypothetical protein [Nitrosospira multiformis]
MNASNACLKRNVIFAKARYGYLLAYLRLRRAAGIVEFAVCTVLQNYFAHASDSPSPIDTAGVKNRNHCNNLNKLDYVCFRTEQMCFPG